MSCSTDKSKKLGLIDHQHTMELSKKWSSVSLGPRSSAALESIYNADCFDGSGRGKRRDREGLDNLPQGLDIVNTRI